MSIGKTIKKIRINMGKTNREFADLLEVQPQYVTNVENGSNPRPKAFIKRLWPYLTKSEQTKVMDAWSRSLIDG